MAVPPAPPFLLAGGGGGGGPPPPPPHTPHPPFTNTGPPVRGGEGWRRGACPPPPPHLPTPWCARIVSLRFFRILRAMSGGKERGIGAIMRLRRPQPLAQLVHTARCRSETVAAAGAPGGQVSPSCGGFLPCPSLSMPGRGLEVPMLTHIRGGGLPRPRPTVGATGPDMHVSVCCGHADPLRCGSFPWRLAAHCMWWATADSKGGLIGREAWAGAGQARTPHTGGAQEGHAACKQIGEAQRWAPRRGRDGVSWPDQQKATCVCVDWGSAALGEARRGARTVRARRLSGFFKARASRRHDCKACCAQARRVSRCPGLCHFVAARGALQMAPTGLRGANLGVASLVLVSCPFRRPWLRAAYRFCWKSAGSHLRRRRSRRWHDWQLT